MLSTVHGTAPSQVIHFDFLYMGPSRGDVKYLLFIKDDLPSSFCLRTAATTDVYAVATELAAWIRVFSAVEVQVSD